MVGATNLGAMRITGIFDPPAVAKEALREGIAVRLDGLTVGRENHDVKLPQAVQDEYLPGITKEGGGPLSSTTENPDAINIQMFGLGKFWLLRNTTVKPGYPIDANSSGFGKPRVMYGASGPVVGYSYQDKVAPAGEEIPFECLMNPHHVEIVMPIIGGSEGSAIGAATKYLAAPGVAVAAAQIPLFVARYAMKLRHLGASLKTAPGGADTVIFTVQKSSDNGATWADTTLTCTITGAAKAASDLDPTHNVDLAAGDLVAIKAVSSAGTAAGPTVTVTAT